MYMYMSMSIPCFLSCYVHVQVHLYNVRVHAKVLIHLDINVYLDGIVGRFWGFHVHEVPICFQDASCKCWCHIIAFKCPFQSDHLTKMLLISKRSHHLTTSANRKIALLVLSMQFAHSSKGPSHQIRSAWKWYGRIGLGRYTIRWTF